ncbi:MAG TPA: methyltransferase domain-containing protein [Candidatus Limnocylindria bacterium]|nr:methyltransferase domain-containing protein [Candidatus Limnocylindria bacterium]
MIDTATSAEELRERMVDRLAGLQGLGAGTVRAFKRVPRDAFLPDIPLERVYSGAVIPTRFDEKGHAISSSSEVGVMTSMIEALHLQEGQHILEIGAGTGYNAAVLSELVGERGSVTTVDIDPEILAEAQARLARTGYDRIGAFAADGWRGWPEGAPYDRIELTVGAADLSPDWNAQLVEGGLLAVPFSFRPNATAIPIFRKDGSRFSSTTILPGGFMPLRGVGAPADLTRAIGEWKITTGRAIDEERLAALLKEAPTVELGPVVPWATGSLLALLEPDSLTLSRADRFAVSIGIFDGEGLAVVEWIGGNLTGARSVLAGLGATATLDRLRARLAQLREVSLGDLRITAVPRGSEPPAGELVFERAHYTFGVSLPS